MATKKKGSIKDTDTVVVTSVDLAADVGSTVLPVANGGTGTGSWTNGQIGIGNTTGNTLNKGTITPVSNQTTVTNGPGSITIGTVQDIATASSPTFAGVISPLLYPASDSTTAVKICKADGTTAVATVDTTNGYFGIGAMPLAKLHVSAVGSSGVNTEAMRFNYANALNSGGYISMWVGASVSETHRIAYGFGSSTVNGYLAFSTFSAGEAERMRLDGPGNMLLGTTTIPTNATTNFVFGGGTTSPVPGAATADLVNTCGFDRVNTRHAAAGNRVLAIQSERGSPIYIGDDAIDFGASTGVVSVNGTDVLSMTSTNFDLTNKVTKYNNITTVASGIPAIVASGRFTAQTAAKSSVLSYTVGAVDSSFEVTANVLTTTIASPSYSFTATVAYTDESNTARTATLSFQKLAGGSPVTTIANADGFVPYSSLALPIRCKSGTTITVATAGTFTTINYNVESFLKQVA